jgi:hypothetical protein
VHVLKLSTNCKRKLLKIEFTTVVFTKNIVTNLFLYVTLLLQTAEFIVDQVENQMHQSVFELLA